jgi:serine/threonine protein kinase
LKAENVLVSADLRFVDCICGLYIVFIVAICSTIKIADFGLSNVMESAARLRTSCGTPGFSFVSHFVQLQNKSAIILVIV